MLLLMAGTQAREKTTLTTFHTHTCGLLKRPGAASVLLLFIQTDNIDQDRREGGWGALDSLFTFVQLSVSVSLLTHTIMQEYDEGRMLPSSIRCLQQTQPIYCVHYECK